MRTFLSARPTSVSLSLGSVLESANVPSKDVNAAYIVHRSACFGTGVGGDFRPMSLKTVLWVLDIRLGVRLTDTYNWMFPNAMESVRVAEKPFPGLADRMVTLVPV